MHYNKIVIYSRSRWNFYILFPKIGCKFNAFLLIMQLFQQITFCCYLVTRCLARVIQQEFDSESIFPVFLLKKVYR